MVQGSQYFELPGLAEKPVVFRVWCGRLRMRGVWRKEMLLVYDLYDATFTTLECPAPNNNDTF